VSLTSWLDGYQRRHRRAGFPLAVVYKYVDDQGGYLAALITYYGFLSLLPLLLLLASVLGFVLRGDTSAQHAILNSTVHQFPVIGQDLDSPRRIGGGVVGTVIGLLGTVYGGLGVGQATQNAMNTCWRVPRNDRPNPLKGRLRSMLLVAVIGLAALATTALSALGTATSTFGMVSRILVLAASVVMNAGVFVLAFRVATARDVGVREVLPGAVGAAVWWQLLQSFGALYVEHVVRHASTTNSVFSVVLGLIGFIYLVAVVTVICVEANVVRVERLYPRALLTPFTDDVELTDADEESYSQAALAQRNKGFQTIRVSFERRHRTPPGDGPGAAGT
jgi:membrane protein